MGLGFLVGIFLIWRLSRAWDLDEENILDLILLTFLGGVVGARLYFGLENLSFFATDPLKIILINKQPGFSFWGAILGGWLSLYAFARTKKMDFWLVSDIASVGFLAGYILADIGCFLGSCDIGIQSKFFLAVNMVGFVGKRFPTQLLEAALLLIVLLRIWSTAVHFHPRGKIISLSLIYIGIIKFSMEFLKQYHDEGVFLSMVLFFSGMTIFYRVSKGNLISDFKNVGFLIYKLLTSSESRKSALDRFKKYCYNQQTSVSWKLRNFKKTLRRFNVKLYNKNIR